MHQGIAFRVALVAAGDRGDAEEAVQDAFVKAYRALGRFREGSPFLPWLLRIVANETHNLRRSARRRATLELRMAVHPDTADPGSPEVAAVAADTHATLLAAVNAMADRDRLVLTCRYFLDLSEAETAQVLGWPRGSVKSRLSRALEKLRRGLPSRLAEEVPRGR